MKSSELKKMSKSTYRVMGDTEICIYDDMKGNYYKSVSDLMDFNTEVISISEEEFNIIKNGYK